MKLYPVTLSMTVLVAADNESDAREAASEQIRLIVDNEAIDQWSVTSDPEIQTLQEWKALGYSVWLDSLPYGCDTGGESCWSILAPNLG